jgi:quercetin dioxygenase-like cupin family protein
VGWLSQVERDISQPEPSDMAQLADLLNVPIGLITPASEEGVIVRKNARRAIGERVAGLTEELVSPDLTDAFEVVHSTFEPGVARSDEVLRPTQEIAYLVSGRLDLWINGAKHTLSPGDSARIRAQSFRWANPYDTPAVALWVIAPPVY